jgi:hypothetical protein
MNKGLVNFMQEVRSSWLNKAVRPGEAITQRERCNLSIEELGACRTRHLFLTTLGTLEFSGYIWG